MLFSPLFEVEGWADKQTSTSLLMTRFKLGRSQHLHHGLDHLRLGRRASRKTEVCHHDHHMGLFSILVDMPTKGEKASKFKKRTRVCTLSLKNNKVTLESSRNEVFLYHLRLLQVLDQAHAAGEIKAYHFALLRQVLENIGSFLGVGQFGYVLKQIGIEDEDEVATIVNTMSHKKVYYFESDDLKPDTLATFDKIFTGLKKKYEFVLHTPAAEVPAVPVEEAMTKTAKETANKTRTKAPKGMSGLILYATEDGRSQIKLRAKDGPSGCRSGRCRSSLT